ncbi:AI-2E family transporter [Nocardiopsis suaedae]|uniref:AI-2E family transporter n=1 Tax=Nocardiopsis suaedae TaxID=3018444 RepID=A0ABT4TH24_9ACTN|nr:AI-2E family transporter [Nocardiopsis suaedae]MDA2804017.1 AI-2E family transporter [Nocardiopsis suaedae]
MKDDPSLLYRLGDAAWRILLIGTVIVLLLWGLAYVKVVSVPVVLAVFLTSMLMPLVLRLRRLGLGRGPATTGAFLGALVVLGGVVTLVVRPAVSGTEDLVESLGRVPDTLQRYAYTLGLDPLLLNDVVDSASQEATRMVEQNRQQLVTGVWSAGTAALEVLVGALLVLVLTVYFLHSGDRLMEWSYSLLPSASRPGLRASAEAAYGVVGRYIRGVAIVGLIDAVGIGVPLLFLIDPALAAPLILLTFLGAFLPIVGAFISGLLAALVAFVTEGLVTALIVVAVVLLVQQAESHIFAPRVYGKALDLPSAVVLVAIACGGVIGGILGMFLATPVAAVVAALLRERPFAAAEAEASEGTAPEDGGGAPKPSKGKAKAKAAAASSPAEGGPGGGGKDSGTGTGTGTGAGTGRGATAEGDS